MSDMVEYGVLEGDLLHYIEYTYVHLVSRRHIAAFPSWDHDSLCDHLAKRYCFRQNCSQIPVAKLCGNQHCKSCASLRSLVADQISFCMYCRSQLHDYIEDDQDHWGYFHAAT